MRKIIIKKDVHLFKNLFLILIPTGIYVMLIRITTICEGKIGSSLLQALSGENKSDMLAKCSSTRWSIDVVVILFFLLILISSYVIFKNKKTKIKYQAINFIFLLLYFYVSRMS